MQRRFRRVLTTGMLTLLLSTAPLLAEAGREEDRFRAEIASILQRRCLSCHNQERMQGDFSLHSAEAVLESGYLEPGEPSASHLLDVIRPVDGKARMPRDADPLSSKEIAAIESWIADGAVWPEGLVLAEHLVDNFDWWSFQPLERPDIRESQSDWGRTPIDAFIAARHQQAGVTHSPEADRRTLIRRVTFDLTGLPPSPEETAAFLADPDPQAYDKLVDRLLASPRYGERWARHWLDVAKYADTCGYDKDKLRPNAWPYRDYVIRSFNEDKPYARFVQEQIAGDVLFPGDRDGILGLGFIAAGPWDFIGHVEVPESKIDGKVARNLDRDDMVSNVINTFCSLTVQCARCHNHKFDPITQEHYYGLQAVFAAVDRAERVYDLDPEVEARKQELAGVIRETNAELTALETEIEQAGGERLRELESQIARLQDAQTVLKQPEFGYHSAIATSADTARWVEVRLAKPTDLTGLSLHPCHDDYAGIGAGFGFPVRFRIEVAGIDGKWQTVVDQTEADFPNPGLRSFDVVQDLTAVERIRITATRLAPRKSDFIFALAELEIHSRGTEKGERPLDGAVVTSLDSIEAPVRWSRDNLIDGSWARYANPVEAEQLADLEEERNVLRTQIETPARIERRKQLQSRLTASRKQLENLPAGSTVYAATTHFPAQGNFKPTEGKPRQVQVLHRGDVQHPKEKADPCVLPLAADEVSRMEPGLSEAERRARLAEWVTSPHHPMLWRSIVNRVWQYHFDQGLVATPNDFGRMGAEPTHPDLLDWLACEFRDSGGSFKHLHRLIVTSSVYRQSSAHHEGHATADAGNQLLWRINRRRLTAEEIRDAILVVSGAMDFTMGGPGYYLFELEKADHSPHYEYHLFDPTDPVSHRRSIYRFVVRSQPDPWMTTLDCADSSQSTPKRNETLTALQALSLLNNPFNLAMSERFADRLRTESSELSDQVVLAFQLIAQREPNAAEQKALERYGTDHGLANLCRVMFNLSEFMYVD
ncbi:PSD1 and planctomycete cytochrome C domain-containing protein [Rubinisphaera margarita]|uniref:PSD1 and planctomycete cytochrome C domain-containing protein n=1 Tax=Rubinisphaera margarita TaxID=2909586 RepID=UPI001EE85F20|nr:PSD1 and planctomycete cytochrome C domain-containing protein [Rubinisphaera margarita]MCG6158281.1 PSD1 and planctomycete cytochrome C domain-containing protein [Rubinisphaera margarita]